MNSDPSARPLLFGNTGTGKFLRILLALSIPILPGVIVAVVVVLRSQSPPPVNPPRLESAIPRTPGPIVIENESAARPKDARAAIQFLEGLPAACQKSHARAEPNGTVVIRVLCEGNDKSLDSTVEVRNGIVTEVR